MEKKRQQIITALTVFINVLLAIAILVTAILTTRESSDLAHTQNVNNIQTLTDASANKTAIALDMNKRTVSTAAYYINNIEGGLTAAQLDAYLMDYYDSGVYNWQVVESPNPTAAKDKFKATAYTNTATKALEYKTVFYSNLVQLFGQAKESNMGVISYTKEFTDLNTSEKSFAVSTVIKLQGSSGLEYRTLMLVVSSSSIKDIFEKNNIDENLEVSNFSNIIINESGGYVISNQFFQDTNIIKYLEKFDSTFDATNKESLKTALEANKDIAPIYFKNNYEEDCVYTFARIDGTDWYVVGLVPISEFSGVNITYGPFIILVFLIALLFVDLTYFLLVSKRLKTSLRKTEDAVELANQASSYKSSFLSRMSHEIRTPLNAVIGYNSIARDASSAAKSETERKLALMKIIDCLNKSEMASKQLLRVINDVLDMSAIESGRIKLAREKFDFKGLVTTLTVVYYSQAKAKNINFEVIFGTITEEWLIGDQMRVDQILANLLSNALKFTPQNGSITLRISQPEPIDNPALIRFELSDTGIGMSPEYLERIWMPFEQADSSISRRFGGSGLGLSITKSLTDIMGGTISVSSVLGEGSTFIVDLPFELVDKQDEPPSTSFDFSKVNALIVDDDPATCEYIVSLFNRCGARCAFVLSGEDALNAVKVARERKDNFSVCLIDWRMPGMDGIETIKQIKEICPDDSLPIVVITAYDYAEIAEEAIEIGVTKFLAKPLFQSSLFDLLADICGNRGRAVKKKSKDFDFKGKKVLLAEDNTMNMEIAKAILTAVGVEVDGVSDGKEVCDKFISSEPGTYKAIFMDVHMPEIDGLQATRKIRASEHAEAKSIPIIAMTADAFVEDIAETKAAGMNDHISKPIDVQLLYATLKKYL